MADGRKVTEAHQLKYQKNAIDLLGLREDNPLMKYGQKADGGVGGDDLRVTVFYQMLPEIDSVQEVDDADFAASGAQWNPTSGTFEDLAGINGNELVRGIHATPHSLFSRVVRGRKEYAKTMLNIDSAIMSYQKSDMYTKLERVFLSKLKALADGTLSLITSTTTLTNVGIPTGNKYGDGAVKFEEAGNLLALRQMISNARIIAGSGREIFFLGGIYFNTLIEVAERFVNTNWADQATKKGGLKNVQEILGGVSMLLNIPRVILRDFDTTFPAATNVRKFFLITSMCYGFDKSEPRTELYEEKRNQTVVFDMFMDYVLEITDPNGFYQFTYLEGLPA